MKGRLWKLRCTEVSQDCICLYLMVFQALWLLFLLFASWLGYVMFEDTLQGKTIFTSYSTTLYQMFVLFTTSNNPDVWIPAYRLFVWNIIFSLFLLSQFHLQNCLKSVLNWRQFFSIGNQNIGGYTLIGYQDLQHWGNISCDNRCWLWL